MKNSLLIATTILLLSCRLSSQTVIGKIVDEDDSGLAGITLNLYISPNVYNTTTSSNGSFSFTVTEVKDEQLPTGYAISNNFPNPFNPKTRIYITMPNGGFYQWNEAMQYVTTPSTKGICPDGWHIPSLEEFQTLRGIVNDDGNALKAIGQGSNNGAGTNASGFSALLVGLNEDGNFHHLGMFAYYWSSTEHNEPASIYMTLDYYGSIIGTYPNWKRYGYCVRCLKD